MLRKLQLSVSRSFAPLDFRHSHYEKAQDLTSYDEVVGKIKWRRDQSLKILVFSELSVSNRPGTDGIKIERAWPGLISVNDTAERGRRWVRWMLAGSKHAPNRTGKLHYASNAMLDRIPRRIGSTIYEREQVKKEETREGERGREREVAGMEEKRSAKETRAKERRGWRVGKGCFVISWRVRGFRHVCLITFQSTRQSATPLSASHHPENYSFILEQLELPIFRIPRSLSLFFFFFPFSFFTLYSAFAEKSILTLLANSFFPTTSRSFAQSRARARLFRSIRLYRCEFFPGFRKPVAWTRELDERVEMRAETVKAWKESRRKLNFIY